MRNRMLFILLLGVYLFYACDSETTANFPTEIIQDSRVSDSIFEILLDDAKLICMDYYTNEEMEEIEEIEFKEYHYAQILAALQFVYVDSVSTASLDIRKYDVHALCHEQLRKSYITVDTSSQNILSWKEYGFSDQLKLDLLIDDYDLQLDSLGKDRYAVHASTGINQEVLALELKQFPFIYEAQSANCIGDGSQIELAYFSPDFIHLIYSYGWGDCPSGCINRHYWELGIYGSGAIELLSESGKELP
ncbi:hypothetical protein [Marinifilum caeruleilacunae]|uniref:Lipoprotein n=1 Tax=Marinifilum caeruleilacunae TaxID=2499076 RepID=A0ABX1WY40_9BACT|nr:hypothetical protein [Marinifilum caeruleilacunae]NOU61031.1 hypothetical protein [Marinifilum caeruleilacunae]